MDDLVKLEEYKAKRAYLMHTETLQMKYLQWYFAIVAAVLAFAYSEKYGKLGDKLPDAWVPLLFLAIYSIFVNLRLILQKRNYNQIVMRLSEIDKSYGNEAESKPEFKYKFLSVFKLQYYAVVLVGAIVVLALFLEIVGELPVAVFISTLYAFVMLILAFSPLVDP